MKRRSATTRVKSERSKAGGHLLNYRQRDHFGDWLGYKVIRVWPKRHQVETELKLRKDHLSPALKVHGGVVAAFLDFACGCAVFTTMKPTDFCSTVEIKVNFLKPLECGDTIYALTEVLFRGKKLCVIHGRLYRRGDKKKIPVGLVTATFNIVTSEK